MIRYRRVTTPDGLAVVAVAMSRSLRGPELAEGARRLATDYSESLLSEALGRLSKPELADAVELLRRAQAVKRG